MSSLRFMIVSFALGLTVMAVLFFQVEWNTRCELNPGLSCLPAGFTPISDSIPYSSLQRRLDDFTRGWDPDKTLRTNRKLLPALSLAEGQLRERLAELSPLAASAYLFRYYHQLERDLEYTRVKEAEDLYRMLLLEALYRASEAIEKNGSTRLNQPLLDFSGLPPG